MYDNESQEGWINTDPNNYGTWYYIGSDDEAVKGWNMIDGEFYYFNYPGGSMTWDNTIDGFYLDNSGKMVGGTGWLQDGITEEWYYFTDGQVTTGWIQDGDKWYYLKADGTMATGLQDIDGDTYYFYSDGEMGTGWEKDNANIWHYFYDNGSMAHDLTVGGYHVDKSGKMVTGTGWEEVDGNWYYLKDDGEVATDWLYDKGNWYYLYSDGSMAYDTTVNGYYLNNDGDWVPDEDGAKDADDYISPIETQETDGAAVTISYPEQADNSNQGQNLIDGVEDIASDAVDWTKNNYKQLLDYLNDKLNSTGAAIVGSAAKAASEIEKEVKIFINEHNLIQLYPESSIIQTMKPFKKIAKVGTFITAISSVTKVITTWTDDSNNTFAQKLAKTGVECAGTIIAIGAGAVNTVVIVALGVAEPETVGTSTAGIIVAVSLDYAEGEGIQAIQKKIYEEFGIEDK